MNPIVKNWLKDMKKGQVCFAFLRTYKAIYDRVAVLTDRTTGLYIQYPRQYRKGWKIESESINASDIVSLRYYQ